MSLQQFLVDNRLELIARTRAKVVTRTSPQPTESQLEHGVPLFLSQLAAQLLEEEARIPGQALDPSPNASIARSATLHGQSLRKFGFTIEQVVHEYGDVCQAVTELAEAQGALISVGEFHTLNRCLDNAIAGAVTSWSHERDKSVAEGEGQRDLVQRELLSLVATATVSFDALRAGRVGSGGATAAIVRGCLVELRSLLDRARLATDQP
jgi:hypothetical protein